MSTGSTRTKLGGAGGADKHPAGPGVSHRRNLTELPRPIGHRRTTDRDDPLVVRLTSPCTRPATPPREDSQKVLRVGRVAGGGRVGSGRGRPGRPVPAAGGQRSTTAEG